MSSYSFDGSAVDVATICVGVVAVLIKPLLRKFKSKKKPCWVFRDCAVDFLNGCALVPFLVLVLAVFSKAFLEEALNTNKISLAISGMIGVMFMFKEIVHEPPSVNGSSMSANTVSDSVTMSKD